MRGDCKGGDAAVEGGIVYAIVYATALDVLPVGSLACPGGRGEARGPAIEDDTAGCNAKVINEDVASQTWHRARCGHGPFPGQAKGQAWWQRDQ
jgi:hypothetical protein